MELIKVGILIQGEKLILRDWKEINLINLI